MDRRDSKKTRNPAMGRSKLNSDENESDQENCFLPDTDLVNDFRSTLTTLNSQFSSLENEEHERK